MVATDKDSSLLGAFMSYKESEDVWILPVEMYSRQFISFITYAWADYVKEIVTYKKSAPT